MASREYQYFEKKTGFTKFFIITALILLLVELVNRFESFVMLQFLDKTFAPLTGSLLLFETPLFLIGTAVFTGIMTEVTRLRFHQGENKASGVVTAFFLLIFIIGFIYITTIILNSSQLNTFLANKYKITAPGAPFVLFTGINTILKLSALYLVYILIAQGEPDRALIFTGIYAFIFAAVLIILQITVKTPLTPVYRFLPGLLINGVWLCSLIVYYLFFNRLIQLDITKIKKISPFLEDIVKNGIPLVTGTTGYVIISLIEQLIFGDGYIKYNLVLNTIVNTLLLLLPITLSLRWTIQTYCAGNHFDIFKIIKKSILPVSLVIFIHCIVIWPGKEIILSRVIGLKEVFLEEGLYYFSVLGVLILFGAVLQWFGALFRGIRRFKQALFFEIPAPLLTVFLITARFTIGFESWIYITFPAALLCLYGLLSLTYLKKSLVLENIQNKQPFIYKKDRQRNVSFSSIVKEKLFFKFSGPASRREFLVTQGLVLLFGLLVFLIYITNTPFLATLKGIPQIALAILVTLFVLIVACVLFVSLSVTVRRLHDMGFSGVIILIPAVFIPIPYVNIAVGIGSLIFLSIKGQKKSHSQVID